MPAWLRPAFQPLPGDETGVAFFPVDRIDQQGQAGQETLEAALIAFRMSIILLKIEAFPRIRGGNQILLLEDGYIDRVAIAAALAQKVIDRVGGDTRGGQAIEDLLGALGDIAIP